MNQSSSPTDGMTRALRVLGWILLGLSSVFVWVVVNAPIDSVQGIMQKILYVHPPLAYGAYLGFVVTAIGGGLFLWHGEERHDQLAIAGAEVGTVFCSLMLITGPIWARGAWGPGNWWVWDARLTLTLLLWFVYLAYLLLRSFTEGEERTARFASIYGILGVVLIPLNYWIIDLVGGNAQHPENIQSGSLGEGMGLPFLVGNLTFFFAFVYLLVLRWRVGIVRAESERLAYENEAAG
ncbi:MAG: cytochrome c biogenesis protein CcsA [Myxococcales bacterium]|nr:cytochrome C assembly protein [Myxococcales bacterium]HIK84842.1 cytochrome C assembly protein [Myxococcales bacterium]